LTDASSAAYLILFDFTPIVSPAELESVLLEHPDIADVAIIGIDSREEATELPRFTTPSFLPKYHFFTYSLSYDCRAYVVHADPTSLKGDARKIEFGKSVQEWIKPRVARHKFLKGGKCMLLFTDDILSWFTDQLCVALGVVIIDVIPKR
jgi:acyl-CoA synthetase (AMP-forming)/AMP-acid ligase II